MSKLHLGITGLALGLLFFLASGGISTHAATLTAAENAQLNSALVQLQVTLNSTQTAMQSRSPAELANPSWLAVSSALSDIHRALGEIRIALAAPSRPNVARANPAPAPRPQVAEQAPTPSTPSERTSSILNDEPVNPSPETAQVSQSAPQMNFSWGKAWAALLILLAGGALIAFSLKEAKPRSSVAVKTEAARASEDTPPGLGTLPASPSGSGGGSEQSPTPV